MQNSTTHDKDPSDILEFLLEEVQQQKAPLALQPRKPSSLDELSPKEVHRPGQLLPSLHLDPLQRESGSDFYRDQGNVPT